MPPMTPPGHAAFDAARHAALDAEVEALLGPDLVRHLDRRHEALRLLHLDLRRGLHDGARAGRGGGGGGGGGAISSGATKNAFSASCVGRAS